jgi:hypothetical protein
MPELEKLSVLHMPWAVATTSSCTKTVSAVRSPIKSRFRVIADIKVFCVYINIAKRPRKSLKAAF